ncbi:MAG: hypothetical protein RR923_02965 [Bacilli bacterium]
MGKKIKATAKSTRKRTVTISSSGKCKNCGGDGKVKKRKNKK